MRTFALIQAFMWSLIFENLMMLGANKWFILWTKLCVAANGMASESAGASEIGFWWPMHSTSHTRKSQTTDGYTPIQISMWMSHAVLHQGILASPVWKNEMSAFNDGIWTRCLHINTCSGAQFSASYRIPIASLNSDITILFFNNDVIQCECDMTCGAKAWNWY